ncbi:MFS transporter [Salinisphaera sp. SWV1]|uniref:MFS transporter n=1 Tax=Salinisphaera sp. SWV1 TaxID=3454139 RepID=UPI003F831A69
MEDLAVQRVCGTSTFLANGFGMGAWSVQIASVQAANGLSDFMIGVTLLVFAVAALGAMQISGKAAARYPVNYLCAGIGVAFALALTALGFVVGIASLIVALAVFGTAHGALDVAINARASMLENRAQRPLMSSFHAAWSVGGAVGAGLAGILAAHGCGPVVVLPATAVIALPALLLALGGHQTAKPISTSAPAETTASTQRLRTILLPLLCAIAFLALFTEGALANWSSIYLKGALAGVSGGFAVGYVAFSVGMSIGRLGGDPIVARYGRRRVGVAGATLAAIGLAVVLARPGLASALICFTLVGIGMSNVVPITFGSAGRVARSEAAGISRAASAGYAGFVIGPPLIGGLAGLVTLPVALTTLVAATALIATFGTFAYLPTERL